MDNCCGGVWLLMAVVSVLGISCGSSADAHLVCGGATRLIVAQQPF